MPIFRLTAPNSGPPGRSDGPSDRCYGRGSRDRHEESLTTPVNSEMEAGMSHTRLTPLDASFLEVESPTAHMHVGWASLFAPPETGTRPSFEALRDHVAARLARAPRYRQKLAKVPLGLNDPVWIDDPDFDIDNHVQAARSRSFPEIVDEVLSVSLDHERPLWELWIADELDDGRIGVVGKAHHCMVDGIAAVELSTLTLDETPETPNEPSDAWRPVREPAPLELAIDGLAARTRQLGGLARLPLDIVRKPGASISMATRMLRAARSSVRPAHSSVLNAPISSNRRLGRAHRTLDELRAVKRAHSGTINDVLLAAAAGGLRRFLIDHG